MLINEVAKQCGITKKAVQYYVEQYMVNSSVLEYGYKDFSVQDVEIIKRIVLYRRIRHSILKKIAEGDWELIMRYNPKIVLYAHINE